MDINEIIYKSNLELDEVKYVVQEYIREKKGVIVRIRLMLDEGLVNPFEFRLLFNAFDTAAHYFANKHK